MWLCALINLSRMESQITLNSQEGPVQNVFKSRDKEILTSSGRIYEKNERKCGL